LSRAIIKKLHQQQSYWICEKDFLFFTAEGAEDTEKDKREMLTHSEKVATFKPLI